MMVFTPMVSPCRGCDNLPLDKEFNPICVYCEKLRVFRAGLAEAEAEAEGTTLVLSPDFSGRLSLDRPICAECGNNRCRNGETLCSACRRKKTPCIVCGSLGIYGRDRCWSCYYKLIRSEKAA